MSEKRATPQQIRKLYAVLRNRGLDPKEYTKKLKEEKGVASLNEFPKSEVSKLIDQLETPNSNPTQNPTTNSTRKTEVAEVSEVSEEYKARLNEIDALFSECIVRATNLVFEKFTKTEQTQATILEIAKMYFEEVKEFRKGAERG